MMGNKYLGSMAKSWSKGTRVKFSKNITQLFVEELAEKAKPFGYRVHVTSGYRSPADQARVVCNNVVNTNGSNLSVYGKTTRKIYKKHCPNNMSAIVNYETEKLAKNIARDPNYQGHGTGFAIDLSVSGMSNSTKRAYKKLIESMGAVVLWEKHPEHFHVWLKKWKPQIDFGLTKVLAYGGFTASLGLTSYLVYLVGNRKGWWQINGSSNLDSSKGSVNLLLQNIRQILDQNNITVAEFGNYIGMSRKDMSRNLLGTVNILTDNFYFIIDGIKDLTGVPITEIIPNTTVPTNKTTSRSIPSFMDLNLFLQPYSSSQLSTILSMSDRNVRRLRTGATRLKMVRLYDILNALSIYENKDLVSEWNSLMEKKYA